jgi:hypothetical protein
MRLRTTWVIGTLVLAAACNSGGERAGSNGQEAARVRFGVEGRSNAAPSVATFGTSAAVVWTASSGSQSDIYISVSRDNGATFGAPVRVNDIDGDARASGEQAARVVLAPANVVHVAWPARHGETSVIRYATSKDGGATFSKAITVAGDELRGARGWHAMALGYDGGVHVVWLDGRNAAPSPRQLPARAGSHGDSAKAGSHDHSKRPMEQPRQDVFHASWKGDDPRSEHPVAASVCFCCKTAVATSGDRVYVAWRHIYPGNIRDIAVARSTDNGATFGTPERLSEDNWMIAGCPDDGPAMAADAHGGIHIAWPTLVVGNAPGETPRKGIFYSARAEGKGFTARVRLDSGQTDTAHPQLASDEHGTTAVVWDERNGKERRIVLREIPHDGAPSAPTFFAGDGVSYPAVAAGEKQWIVVWVADAGDGALAIEGRRIPRAATP